MSDLSSVDVVVIGAGQAGLSAAYHLGHRGYVDPRDAEAGERTFVVLDANPAPGGAWQHRWDSLRMGTVNGIYELPGYPVPAAAPTSRANEVLPEYFAQYEERLKLQVRRPVSVRSVTRHDDDPQGRLDVRTSAGDWSTRFVINATGTWTQPYLPFVPGWETFRGRQLHVAGYVSAEQFRGQRVVIVGGGVSAVQLLDEIADVADTFWVTRRAPNWHRGEWTSSSRIEALDAVEQRSREGHAPGSIISVTGDIWSPWAESAERKGVLVRHPMFSDIVPDGVRMPDGTIERADVILWATGFKPALGHLAPLSLRTALGGVRVADSRAVDEQRLFLIGYGPSQSTIGANRAGRAAVRAISAEDRATAERQPAAVS